MSYVDVSTIIEQVINESDIQIKYKTKGAGRFIAGDNEIWNIRLKDDPGNPGNPGPVYKFKDLLQFAREIEPYNLEIYGMESLTGGTGGTGVADSTEGLTVVNDGLTGVIADYEAELVDEGRVVEVTPVPKVDNWDNFERTGQ